MRVAGLTGLLRRAWPQAVGLGFGLALCLPAIAEPGSAAAAPVALEMTRVAPGVYLRRGAQADAAIANRGHIANLGFIVGRRAVAVIDTGGSLAEGRALRAAVRAVTDRPISHVILTHMHPDHVLGAAAFEADRVAFVGHHRLADALARRATHYLASARAVLGGLAEGTRVILPDVAVQDRLRIDLGQRVLDLQAWPTAHTDNDLSVHDRTSDTLWLSDLLFVERVPVIDGSLLGWLRVIDRLGSDSARRVVPGHGPVPADWPRALAAQRRYLQTLAEGIRAVIARRGRIGEAVATVAREERDHWLLFDAYHGRNVTAGFVELEWE